jgi:membrane associated rhomboid family serine protease
MGIYDRDYYRSEGYSFLGSWTERGKVCKWLIGINVVVFIAQLVTMHVAVPGIGSSFVTDLLELRSGAYYWTSYDDFKAQAEKQFKSSPPGYPPGYQEELGAEDIARAEEMKDAKLRAQYEAASRPGVLQGQVWRLLTYAFLHDTTWIMHILFNMLFLWWFGTDVEDLYGPKEFLAIYLVSAFLGGVVFVVTQALGIGGYAGCVGASGAVMAVLVLCCMHYPTRTIRVFFLLPVPIWMFVLFMVASDAFTFLSGVNTGTAVSVHLAGAGFAFAYYKLHWNLMDTWSGLWAWRRRARSRPRLRVYPDDEPVTPVAVSSPSRQSEVDEHLEAQVDALLEKVSRFGQDSLTDSEREILFRASEAYKRRKT